MTAILIVLATASLVGTFIWLLWLARTGLDHLHVTDFERKALADRAVIQRQYESDRWYDASGAVWSEQPY